MLQLDYHNQPSNQSWLVVFRHPSEKYDFVSWDYDIPNIWKVIQNSMVPNHQPDIVDLLKNGDEIDKMVIFP